MITIPLPASGLTVLISISDTLNEIVGSGEMIEGEPSNDGSFWYGFAFTGTPGASYRISIDASEDIENPLIRFQEMWVTEDPLPAPSSSIIASEVRTELTIELARLDVAISTRLSTASYTAPDNSAISAIKTKTDQLIFTGANLNTVAKLVEDKTGYTLTALERTNIATAVEQSILNEGDGQAILNAIVGAIGNQNIDQLALVGAIRADMERVGGKLSGIPTNPLLTTDTRLNNLDAPISGAGGSSGGLTPEQETKINDIKLKTDNLPLSPASTDDVQNTVIVNGGFSELDRATLVAIPTLAEIEGGAKILSIESKLALLERMERATVRIDGTQLVLEDLEGEIQRWAMKDSNGQPTSSIPYKKERIG